MKRSAEYLPAPLLLLVTLAVAGLGSCSQARNQAMMQGGYHQPMTTPLPASLQFPSDGSLPVTGTGGGTAARTVTFSAIGQRIDVKNGETVNLIYDGIDPETSYLRYESTDDGYTLELAQRNDFVVLDFKTLCQVFVVESPTTCAVSVPENLRYEQVVWTPRSDGLWEARIGSVNRGCRSEALDRLDRLRNSEYEKKIPRGSKGGR
jgi:hypothetical protein